MSQIEPVSAKALVSAEYLAQTGYRLSLLSHLVHSPIGTIMVRSFLFTLVVSAFLAPTASAFAQGLIWKLPEDGKFVRFEGKYSQVEARTDKDPITIDWIQHITIKSVGQEMRDYKGAQVQCRWLEFKIQTGKAGQGKVETGLVGERLYKVLIPEQAIIAKTRDADGIVVTYLPIVEGFFMQGNDATQKVQLKHGVFNVFPKVSLVRHHKDFEEPIADSVSIQNNDVDVQMYRASLAQESLTDKVQHETKLYRSDAMPFGLAQWSVKINLERKAQIDDRSDFEFRSEVNVTMTAVEIGENAQSEF